MKLCSLVEYGCGEMCIWTSMGNGNSDDVK